MITLKSVAIEAELDWDDGKGSVVGFGAHRQKSEAIAYLIKYRTADGRQRWHTIGRHGSPWTPDMARAEARRILGEVAKVGSRRTARRRLSPNFAIFISRPQRRDAF